MLLAVWVLVGLAEAVLCEILLLPLCSFGYTWCPLVQIVWEVAMGMRARRVAVTLPQDELDRLEAAAERVGLSLGAYCRVLLLATLEQHGLVSPPPPGYAGVLRALEPPVLSEGCGEYVFRAERKQKRKPAVKPSVKPSVAPPAKGKRGAK